MPLGIRARGTAEEILRPHVRFGSPNPYPLMGKALSMRLLTDRRPALAGFSETRQVFFIVICSV
jgi:hypothetical protein